MAAIGIGNNYDSTLVKITVENLNSSSISGWVYSFNEARNHKFTVFCICK